LVWKIPLPTLPQHASKTKFLGAALDAIRAQGYAATTVEDICRRAGVSKGSFFHHFKSKDELALAAVAHWDAVTQTLFAAAPYRQAQDPLLRVLGYLDFRASLLSGGLCEYTCPLGVLVQEVHATHPEIRAACERSLYSQVTELTADLEAARRRYAPDSTWSAESVGYFIQSVLQGSFIFAKASQGPEIARANLAHLRRYLQFLFNQSS
jgi:TetR/AcrR family transcriptional repressor of nem operon